MREERGGWESRREKQENYVKMKKTKMKSENHFSATGERKI